MKRPKPEEVIIMKMLNRKQKFALLSYYCENTCWEQINPGMAELSGGTNM